MLNASENEINGNEQDDEKENVEDSNNTSPKRHYNKWTEHEALILVYLVTKIGKDFSAIITNYEQYFPNRTKEHLANKYNSLRGTKKLRSNLLKNLEKQASSLTDIPIVKIEKEQHEHKKNLNWKFKEVFYLRLKCFYNYFCFIFVDFEFVYWSSKIWSKLGTNFD